MFDKFILAKNQSNTLLNHRILCFANYLQQSHLETILLKKLPLPYCKLHILTSDGLFIQNLNCQNFGYIFESKFFLYCHTSRKIILKIELQRQQFTMAVLLNVMSFVRVCGYLPKILYILKVTLFVITFCYELYYFVCSFQVYNLLNKNRQRDIVKC